MQPTPRLLSLAALATLALVGCGKKADPKAKHDAGPTGPAIAPIATPVVGVDSIKRMNFIYEAGAPSYEKAVAAYRAKPRDWAAIRSHTEAALAKDPNHYDAHRLLASALAKSGDHAAAADHLVIALAADHGKYGPSIAKDDDLKEFLATPHGAAVTEVAARIAEEYTKRITGGIWLVGRRSAYKWPRNRGVETSTTRGELYAFDRETRRYLRLTHTEHQVAGFVRSPGPEVAVLGFDKIDRPKDGADAPPTFARAWLEVLDTTTWERLGPRVQLGGAREVAAGYAEGAQLLIATAAASGRWGLAAPVVSSLDRTTGKLTKVGAQLPALRVALSLEEGRLVRFPDVTALWSGEPPTAPAFETGGTVIRVPESGAAAQASVAIAPGGGRIAFATAVDPCAKNVAPSLYVADTKSGALKHVLTAPSRFATRWVDATTLAYEDGDGAIRLWDATTGREAMRLDNKAGLALDALSLSEAPLCKQAPPAVEDGGGSGDEPPLPPEEPGGPVTTPQ
ncbi:MAG: tetratricopeptide repeat protein [Kofleriaceae bacterium]